jgi:hypothetical protein
LQGCGANQRFPLLLGAVAGHGLVIDAAEPAPFETFSYLPQQTMKPQPLRKTIIKNMYIVVNIDTNQGNDLFFIVLLS